MLDEWVRLQAELATVGVMRTAFGANRPDLNSLVYGIGKD